MDMDKCREGCPFFESWSCKLLAGHLIDQFIDGCPLELNEIMKDQLFEGSQLYMIATTSPISYLRSISYLRRDLPPRKGDICLSLSNGFNSSSSGVMLEVTYSDDYVIHLQDVDVVNRYEYIIEVKDKIHGGWYHSLFVYKENQEEYMFATIAE